MHFLESKLSILVGLCWVFDVFILPVKNFPGKINAALILPVSLYQWNNSHSYSASKTQFCHQHKSNSYSTGKT